MAEELIDIRDRIEKMRIQIENEATEQISANPNVPVHQKTSNSNISLSMENKNSFPNQNFKVKNDSDKFDDIVALLALYRPGPLDSGMVDEYILRKNGKKKYFFFGDSIPVF